MNIFDNLSSDPLEIIYKASDNVVSANSNLYLGEIVLMLRIVGVLVCLIAIAWSLIKMLLINEPKQLQEEKTEITHRLCIVVIIASVISLMNFIKDILDMFFY